MLYSGIIQWNLNLTKCQGPGEICSLYRGFVISRFYSIHFTVTLAGLENNYHLLYQGLCYNFYRASLNRGSTVITKHTVVLYLPCSACSIICFSAFFRLFALDIRASLGTNIFCFPFPFPFPFPDAPGLSGDIFSFIGAGRASDSILSVFRRRFSFSLSTVH